jgi:hypothetical protein
MGHSEKGKQWRFKTGEIFRSQPVLQYQQRLEKLLLVTTHPIKESQETETCQVTHYVYLVCTKAEGAQHSNVIVGKLRRGLGITRFGKQDIPPIYPSVRVTVLGLQC